MNKTDLINCLQQSLSDEGITKKDIELVVNSTFITIADLLSQGEKVSIKGFGNFEVRDRASRVGRNPATGEPLPIPASKSPFWKPSEKLKELLN
jgi:DNA-binding protein HU-beta